MRDMIQKHALSPQRADSSELFSLVACTFRRLHICLLNCHIISSHATQLRTLGGSTFCSFGLEGLHELGPLAAGIGGAMSRPSISNPIHARCSSGSWSAHLSDEASLTGGRCFDLATLISYGELSVQMASKSIVLGPAAASDYRFIKQGLASVFPGNTYCCRETNN